MKYQQEVKTLNIIIDEAENLDVPVEDVIKKYHIAIDDFNAHFNGMYCLSQEYKNSIIDYAFSKMRDYIFFERENDNTYEKLHEEK